MTSEVLCTKVCEYATTILAPRAKSWTAKFAIGASIPMIRQKIPKMLSVFDVVGKDGEVDILRLETSVLGGFQSAGHLDLFGGVIGFDKEDAKALFDYLKD
ncbi:MAG: hypothetical protein ACI305_05930 [Lepagella sp.]